MREAGFTIAALFLAACSSPAPQSTTAAADCRTATAACASGFECTKAPGGAWECRKLAAPTEGKSASAAALPTSATPPPVTKISKLTEGEVASLVRPRLKAGEQLAHAVFKGPIGPGSSAVFAVAGKDGGFVAFALASDAPGSVRIDLPSFYDWNNGMGEVKAIMLDDIDGDSIREPIVMTTFVTGVGSEGAIERPMNAIFDWNGTAFARRTDLENRIVSSTTAKEIRTSLGY